ncbi:hypothetical protein [Deinococcus ruber]|uniref:hypothetical protein n=1 Tax=Deinococcus ruber TaxID=1848197 RepID=UPI001663F9EA|nr:hypothetical protein [Deinococcus ruber]
MTRQKRRAPVRGADDGDRPQHPAQGDPGMTPLPTRAAPPDDVPGGAALRFEEGPAPQGKALKWKIC